MRVGQEEWKELKGSDTPMTLGSWMAVSGAAVAPGLGKLTRGGVAALLVFAGVRLGYWWRQPEKDKKHWSDFLTKSWGLMRETLAIFEGKEGRDWFMTDGGHFENTGAYALLSERAEVIVVVDCGADPDYTFGDVENLVRKARIDLQADIEFLRPRRALPGEVPRGLASEPSGFYGALHAFGSLQELASNASNACLAVARINYSDRDGVVEVGPKLKRERGILLIVKPNMCKGLPIDLQNFKRAAPTFPQETTADQFFSEAQWESYFRLGQVLAQDLSPAFIEALRADCVKNEPAHFVPDDCSVALSGAALNGDEKAARGRIIGSVGATAVGASIGLGAAATLGVSAWQAIDSVKVGSASRVDRERKALDELSDLWSKLPAALPANARPTQVAPQLEALASELLKTADTLCPAGEVDWFKRSELARRIYADTLSECRKVVPYVFSRACKGLVEAEHPEAQSRLAVCLKQEPGKTSKEPLPRYWGYDYSAVAPLDGMHLCSPFRAELLKARNRYLADYGEADDQSASLSGKDAGAPESDGLGARRACPKVEATPAGAPPPAVSPADGSTSTQLRRRPHLPHRRLLLHHQRQSLLAATPRSEAARASPARASRSTSRFTTAARETAYVPIVSVGSKWAPACRRSRDVTESARKNNLPPPRQVSQPTVRYHDKASIGCAYALLREVGYPNWSRGAAVPPTQAEQSHRRGLDSDLGVTSREVGDGKRSPKSSVPTTLRRGTGPAILQTPDPIGELPMPEAFIVAAARTAGGRRNGRLAGWHPADLAAQVLNALVERTDADPALVEDVIMGCVDQAGEQSSNIARNAVLASKLPESVPATSVDRQCGSSQQALHFAAQAVMSGSMDIVIAAGVESMTRVPMGMPSALPLKNGLGFYVSPLMARRYPDIQFSQFTGAEMIARNYGIEKDELDRYAFESHKRAIAATQAGPFRARDRADCGAHGRRHRARRAAHHRRGHPLRRHAGEHCGRQAHCRRWALHRRHRQPDLRRRERPDGGERARPEDAGREAARAHPPHERDGARPGDHAGGSRCPPRSAR